MISFEKHCESLAFLATSVLELALIFQMFRVFFFSIVRDLGCLSNDHSISTVLSMVMEAIQSSALDFETFQLVSNVCIALRLRHTELFELGVVPVAIRHGSLLYAQRRDLPGRGSCLVSGVASGFDKLVVGNVDLMDLTRHWQLLNCVGARSPRVVDILSCSLHGQVRRLQLMMINEFYLLLAIDKL